jgi:hypothetical protein
LVKPTPNAPSSDVSGEAAETTRKTTQVALSRLLSGALPDFAVARPEAPEADDPEADDREVALCCGEVGMAVRPKTVMGTPEGKAIV